MGLGLAGLRRAPSRSTWSAKSTTSRLKNSSRQLVGRLARKVESDSPVGIPGAPGRLVDDLKTEVLRITYFEGSLLLFSVFNALTQLQRVGLVILIME
jgi:hypothetical protein